MAMEADKLSNLPSDLINKILTNLPLRDAVRTAILSSIWRYKWANVTHIVIDRRSLNLCPYDDDNVIDNRSVKLFYDDQQLVNIIDHLLLLHNGPIHKFALSNYDLQPLSYIDRWILVLSRRSSEQLKEFILEILKWGGRGGPCYKLPSSLYSCQSLTHLELFNCILKPPPVQTFNGFKSLKTLILTCVSGDQIFLEKLISSCTLLEQLTLVDLVGFPRLNIHAPNLVIVSINSGFEDVSFENALNLSIVSVGWYKQQNQALGNAGKLTNFLASLPHIKRLELQNFFLKFLAVGIVPKRVASSCMELNYLSICINFNDMDERSAALCLLRSSPNLRELKLQGRVDGATNPGGAVGSNYQEKDYQKCVFNQMRVIEISGISGADEEMNFISFLLESCPLLEKMSVKPDSVVFGERELLKKLLQFRRASQQTEIIYMDT